jgi:ligand-binding SRPBCC domain-containing protein
MKSPGGVKQGKGRKTEIILQNRIEAPIERCFDLARSIDFHVQSAASTREQAVGGVTSGLIEEGQEVEWRAQHFGFWLKMRVRITGFRRPEYFQDRMVEGPFHSFAHDHNFEAQGLTTLMTDRINFRSPVPLVGRLLDRLVLRRLRHFVSNRNAQLKTAAESNAWQHYLKAHVG